jgi:hypothetical protein
MWHKLKSKQMERRKIVSLKSIEEITLPDLREVKSVSKGGMLSLSKLLYFKEEDMVMVAPKELHYVKQALS